MWVRDWFSANIWPGTASDTRQTPAEVPPPAETQEEADARMARINQSLSSTAAIGDAILVELDRQDEKIEEIKEGMDHLEHSQKSAANSIHHLKWGVVERAKDPKFVPEPRQPVQAREPVVAPVRKQNRDKVKIDYDAVGQGESEKGLEGISDQLARLNQQARLMGSSIKASHQELKKVAPRVEEATAKSKEHTRQLKGIGKK